MVRSGYFTVLAVHLRALNLRGWQLLALSLLMPSLLIAGCGQKQVHESPFPPQARGKLVFVNYWAEWCKPCREEIPELNEFAREHVEKIVLYGVNFDGAQGEELVRQQLALGIDFDTLTSDPAAALGWPRPAGLPHTVIADENGNLIAQLPGKQSRESLNGALVDHWGK